MRPSVVRALEFLGGAVMANTATEDSTTVSGAPDTTVELAGDASAAGTVIAWDGQRILPQVRDRAMLEDISLRPRSRGGQPQ